MKKAHRVQFNCYALAARYFFIKEQGTLVSQLRHRAHTLEEQETYHTRFQFLDAEKTVVEAKLSQEEENANVEQKYKQTINEKAFQVLFEQSRKYIFERGDIPRPDKEAAYVEFCEKTFDYIIWRLSDLALSSSTTSKEVSELITNRYTRKFTLPRPSPTMAKHAEYFLEAILHSSPEPWKYWPVFLNPVTKWRLLLPLTLVKPEVVVCSVSGEKISRRDAYKTAYGSFVSREVWEDRPDVHNEFAFCEFEHNAHGASALLYRRKDLVAVYNSQNAFAHRNVSRKVADKNFKKSSKNGRYYNFDIDERSAYIIGVGWFSPKEATRKGAKFEKAVGAWMHDNNFNLLSHSDDVLNYFDGFKHMPYEEVTRGNKNHALNTLFMGMELEVEMSKKATMNATDAARETVLAMEGHAVCVSDGSLNNGYEVVSVPATLNYHYGIWEKLLRGPLRKQIVSYMRPSCGIHIHMSKEAFSSLALGKFMTFINLPENQKFIEVISQRSANQYNLRPPTKVSAAKNRDTFIENNGRRHGKYVSCNLTNEHTVEVRIFKGTLAYPQVMKNFEFCHALHKYCSFSAANNALLHTDFIKWLMDKDSGNRKSYPYLYDFLKVHKFIVDTTRPASSVTKQDVTDEMSEKGTEGVDRLSEIPPTKMEYIKRASVPRNVTREVA